MNTTCNRALLSLLSFSLLCTPLLMAETLPDALVPLAALEEEAEFVAELKVFTGEHTKRISDIKDALQSKQSENADQQAALKEELSSHFQLLENAYALALRRYKNNSRVQNLYGEFLYDHQGKQGEALRHWKTAQKLDPKFALPYNNLGIHYAHTGEHAKGLELYEKALDLDSDNPDILFNLVQFHLIYPQVVLDEKGWTKKSTVYKKAMKFSKKAVRLAPDDYTLRQDYAVNFLAGENFGVKVNWKDAAKAWQQARPYVRNREEEFYNWLNEGRSWKSANRFDDARLCFEESLKILPDSKVAKKLLKSLDEES